MSKIALAQINIKAGQPSCNLKTIKKAVTDAVKHGAELIVFPAYVIAGKMVGNMTEAPDFIADCQQCVREIVNLSKEIDIAFGTIDGIFLARNGSCQKLTTDSDGNIKLTVKNKSFICQLMSSQFYQGKKAEIDMLISKLTCQYNLPLIYVNNTGIQNNGKTLYVFDGNSAVFAADGTCVFSAPAFTEMTGIFDLDNLTKTEITAQSELSEICAAVKYGTKEFLTSIGVKKVVIGISGGIDSAVSAALYGTILPPENIYLINMPSRFNSDTTKTLAKKLAENLGANYAVMPIEESVNLTVKQLSNTPFYSKNLPVSLDVTPFVTENIQARDRSARILAAVAACVGGVFTCNANKAETTIGYSTLYGDSSGFFAPLADLWKHQVYGLARYFNEVICKKEIIPQGTIDIVPSAELSTSQDVNAGKGDPLTYPYHDYLFRAFTEHNPRLTPADYLQYYIEDNLAAKIGCEPELIKKLFPTAKEFIADLERWWNLYTGMAVAKRIQAPPILAVSRKPFGGDYNEAQNGVYYSLKYQELKKSVI